MMRSALAVPASRNMGLISAVSRKLCTFWMAKVWFSKSEMLMRSPFSGRHVPASASTAQPRSLVNALSFPAISPAQEALRP